MKFILRRDEAEVAGGNHPRMRPLTLFEDVEQAVYLMEMLDAIYLSSSLGRDVPIPRAEKTHA